MSESVEYLYRVKIAFQLSFIVWVMIGIFLFYATFEGQSKMLGTFLLLFSVILFTPFLPDGTDYSDIENLNDYKEEKF
ncbi:MULTISPECIES: hypothetical protein [unclassified Methanosarcina]|uniref:hypothetical protein n=1 Tax=unclassified Methanosarcina TaxID=2644672 RepID=UPI000A69F8BB|nr:MULTISPECIES: hypothetical protein [unclassified Methanosarcina]